MKTKSFGLLLMVVFFTTGLRAQNLENTMDSVSYGLGVLMAQNLQQQGFDELDAASLAEGINAVLSGSELKIQPEEANQLIQEYMTKKQAAEHQDKIADAAAFLEKNGQRAEVTTTASGLQYEVLKEGTGATPAASSSVTVHYVGTLLDGTEFDSSVKRGEPATFGVNQVIAGWTEALQLMKEGDKYKLYIPYNLGYGERGTGPIPPFATLVFEVELLKVN